MRYYALHPVAAISSVSDTVQRYDADGPSIGAPTNDEGYYVCNRECADGTACRRIVPLPRTACHAHGR